MAYPMLRSLYQRVLQLAAGPRAPAWLFAIAFAEARFFPLPPDALLIPMALARPKRALFYALVATLGSVLGGMLGYVIGYFLFSQVAEPLLRFYHYGDAFAAFQARFNQFGLEIILIKGLLPIPYKIVTIACGVAKFDFATFVAASIVTRGARFVLWAVLLRVFGERARGFIDRQLPALLAAAAAAAVAGFVMLKYV